MSWLYLVAAALGGGVVASFLESWTLRLRDFETARLLIGTELTGNLQSCASLGEHSEGELYWVTAAWMEHRAKLAHRLQLRDNETWSTVAAFYEVVLAEPPRIADPLRGDEIAYVRKALDALNKLRLPWYEAILVYGP